MGIVYKAFDPALARPVAIKLVRADLMTGEDSEAFVARFLQEARAAGRCLHPNVVSIYDFAMHEKAPYLAMEFVEGIALGQALKNTGRFAPAAAVAIVVQLLAGLSAAHALGVIHRDVKPANVLVMDNGAAKVTDFGIARLNDSDLTHQGTVIGTPAYMSPEQCRGEAVDVTSDLFSTGSVLYELLTGNRAFSGVRMSDVSYAVINADPPDLSAVVGDLPDLLSGTLRRAMAKDRARRFRSADEMAAALRESIGGAQLLAPGTAPETPPVDRAFTPAEAAQGLSASGSSASGASASGSSASGSSIARPSIDSALLERIAARLAAYVGPIAGYLVRDAAKTCFDLESLCEKIAVSVDQAERKRFAAEVFGMRPPAHGGPVTATPGGATPEGEPRTALSARQIELAREALTQTLGPIAGVLVKRAAARVSSEAQLWEELSRHIDDDRERRKFMSSRTA